MFKNKAMVLAVLTAMILTFSGRDNKKEIEEKYRFSNGNWCDEYGSWVDETVSVGQNTIQTTTGIYIDKVYTSGGGDYTKGSWAYLYNKSGKIGIIYTFEESIYITLGKATVSDKSGWHYEAGIPGINFKDMKNTINGKGIFGAAG